MQTFLINTSTKKIVDDQEVRRETNLVIPQITPEYLVGTKYGVVIENPAPECEQWQYCEESFVKDPNGYWQQTWTIKDHPQHVKDAIILRRYDAAFTVHLDNTARQHGYDDHRSMILYRGSSVPKFRAEGQAMSDYRDNVWLMAQEWLADHTTTPPDDIPSPQDLIALLPPFSVAYDDN